MNAELSSQAHHLLQIGLALLLAVSLQGFVIPKLRAPRLGVSAHTVGLFLSLLLLAIGLIWPTLRFGGVLATVTFWLLLYAVFGTWVPYVLASVWRAGASIVPLAAGDARGTPGQEAIIKTLLMSSAPATVAAVALILWAL